VAGRESFCVFERLIPLRRCLRMKKERSGENKVPLKSGIVWALLGLITTLILFEVSLRAIGAVSRWTNERGGMFPEPRGKYYRILCLGESTTAVGADKSYPYQLEKILNQSGAGIRFVVINGGETAINSSYIMEHLENNLDRYRPDMVTAMMGINERVIRFYADIPEADSWIFRNCRTYRFFRLMFNEFLRKSGNKDARDAAGAIKAGYEAGFRTGDRINYDLLRNNYRKMKSALDSRKIRLCCVQYPVRSIAVLVSMFDRPGEIIFVDNEWNFKDAIGKGKYDDYFMDSFAGDFGHCTPKGNRLIAENMAGVILKELFPRLRFNLSVENR
jgi:lysophospholipase L1-like esterase